MTIRTWLTGAIAAMTLLAAPASASKIVFSGTGTVDKVTGRLTPTGTATVGSPLAFSFSFDTDLATLYEADDFAAVYDLPGSVVSATIGSYALTPSVDPVFVPGVAISRGFSFFGGNSTEPSLALTFYFAGIRKTGVADGSPFALAPNSFDSFSFTSIFKADANDTGLGLDQLKNPADAPIRSFVYSARDVATNRGGALQGSFVGGFAIAAGVPEPATWAMMIAGFGIVGGALRRRRSQVRVTHRLA